MVRPGSPPPLWGVAGKAGYALSCVAAALVLAVSGFSYFVVRDVSSIGGSHAINSGPSIGAQNILLMGLESRTDWNGNVLPNDILNALHAGSRQGVLYQGVGGNATNTLILIHIPAGGKKAIGFSIPRDDWVTFPETYDGQTQGKIDQAYGDALAEKESQVRQQNPGMSQSQVAFQGNEAGRAATVATVESFTGVQIDHFAEVNLDGFYELAKVLGGVQVCLKQPVPLDTYSGFYAKKAGYQHLNAKMALAFVRQRHGLTQRRPRPYPSPAGLPGLGHAAAAHRGRARRPGQDQLAAVGGQAVRDHRLRLGPARLRHPDAQPDQRQPELQHAADRELHHHRRPGRQPGQPALHPAARAPDLLPGARAPPVRPGRSPRPRSPSARPRPPRPPSTCSTEAVPRGSPGRSRPPWSRTGSRRGRSRTPPR